MVSQVVKADPSSHWPPLEESMVSSHEAPAVGPQPMDGLQSTAPPPFLTKTYDMVDDAATDAVVSWSAGSNSFVVWNPPDFAQELLPKYFKHNNFSSFVRQLNTYGFRKVDPDRWEFANEGFLRGRRDLLKTIHRRKPATHLQQAAQPQQQMSEQATVGPCVEVGKFGLEGEIERLKRDKNVLMVELVRLRQQQQNTEREMQSMGQRLLATENRQQHMMSFLAKAMQNPSFLAQLMQQSEKKRLATTVRKKRRLPKRQDSSEEDSVGSDPPAGNQIVAYNANGGGAESDGARAMIMQFFNSADAASSPSLDSGPLEALFRDLGSAPSGPDVGNRQSGVTLTEMNTPGLSDALPGAAVVMDASPEYHEMPPHPSPRIPRLQGSLSMNVDNGSKYSSADMKPEDLSGESMEFNVDGTRLVVDGEEGILNMGSPGLSTANDNLFWEQFLSESPSAVDHELERELGLGANGKEEEEEGDGEDETIEDSVEDENGGGKAVKDWWSKKPGVEQLSVQMGQLAPG